MRVTFGYMVDRDKGTVISFFGLPTPQNQSGRADGFAVVLADEPQIVSGGRSRFIVVPLSELKTDPPDRKWGLS